MASSLVEGPRKLPTPLYDTRNLVLERCTGCIAQHLYTGRSRKPLSESDASVVDSLLGEETLDDGVFKKCLQSETSTAKEETMRLHLRDLCVGIVEEVGPMWKDVGWCLLKKEFLLSSIDEDYTGLREKTIQMFIKWRQLDGQNATAEKLCRTLVQVDCYDALEKLGKLEPALSPLLRPACLALHVGATLCNVEGTYREFQCEKCLLCGKLHMVHLWQNKSTQRKYIVKALDDNHHTYALRKVIDPKALQQRRKNLQKTSDIKESEKVVNHLLGVVDKLQTHISDHWNFCQQGQNCGDCDKSKLQQDLIMGELALLHYQLGQMTSGRRRMSLSGVSHERIYRLAERTFSVCEEHRKMHQMVRRKSCASLNDLDSCDDSSEDEFIGPIQCNLNILLTLSRRRPTTQSLRKKNVEHQPLKKTRSNESSSTFYVPSPLMSRQLFPEGEHVPRSYKLASEILKPSKTSASNSNTTQGGGNQIKDRKSFPPSVARDMKSRGHAAGMPKTPGPDARARPQTAPLTIPRQREASVTSPRVVPTAAPPPPETFFRRLSQHQLKWNSDVEGSVQV